MGIRRSSGSLKLLVDAASQRQAYNNFRKVRVLYRKIVERTPVLSGELRAGWNVSYGRADYSYVDVKNKRNVHVPLSAPVFDLEYDPLRAWNIVISNGVPYANRVERGWSQQAPVGMVRISVLEVFGV